MEDDNIINMVNVNGAFGAELEKAMMHREEENLNAASELEIRDAISDFTNKFGVKDSSNKELKPNGYTVIFTKYDRNPYRKQLTSSSGLVLDVGYDAHEYEFSHETGKMERNDLGVVCCKVVAVGPECKYVKPGEDVYIRDVGCAPIPFAGNDYWAISEQNIICRIVNKI